MNKEEILTRSRNENKGMDIVGLQSLEEASRVVVQVGILLRYLVAVMEVAVTRQVSMESWLIYFDTLSTLFLVEYHLMKRRHGLFLSIFYIVLFLIFLVLFLWKLLY